MIDKPLTDFHNKIRFELSIAPKLCFSFIFSPIWINFFFIFGDVRSTVNFNIVQIFNDKQFCYLNKHLKQIEKNWHLWIRTMIVSGLAGVLELRHISKMPNEVFMTK